MQAHKAEQALTLWMEYEKASRASLKCLRDKVDDDAMPVMVNNSSKKWHALTQFLGSECGVQVEDVEVEEFMKRVLNEYGDSPKHCEVFLDPHTRSRHQATDPDRA